MVKLLSIVIPAYNVEAYIRKCLESLLLPEKELLSLLDVIVVNDGSKDNSGNIAREFENKYPDVFRVIDQENRGHGGAWNHGTELAVGKFVFYLDSDDWCDTEELHKLVKFLCDCNTDMVFFESTIYHSTTRQYEQRPVHGNYFSENIVYDADAFDWSGCGKGYMMTYAHDTIYRTAMMQKCLPLFCEKVMYDDVSLQVIPIMLAKDFIYVRFNVYIYLLGRSGQSYDPEVRKLRARDDVSKVVRFCMDWITEHRSIVPNGGKRAEWADLSILDMGEYHYKELARLPIRESLPRLKEWHRMINNDYPAVSKRTISVLYSLLPGVCFIWLCRVLRFVMRVFSFLKRKWSAMF